MPLKLPNYFKIAVLAVLAVALIYYCTTALHIGLFGDEVYYFSRGKLFIELIDSLFRFDFTTSEELLDKITVPKTTSLRKLLTRSSLRKRNKDNEDTYLKNIKSDLLFYKNNKSDFVWDGRYGLGRKYSPKRSITVPEINSIIKLPTRNSLRKS